jgi:integration host factor subunit beta
LRFDNPKTGLETAGLRRPERAGARHRTPLMTDEPLTITKKELVNRIADQTGQTKVIVKDVLQRFLDEIIEELSSGNRLEFREFGVFEVRERAARRAQNPRTLEKVAVPAKRVVKFKVGRLMRERVCDERPDERAARLKWEVGATTQRTVSAPAPAPAPIPEPPASNSPF